MAGDVKELSRTTNKSGYDPIRKWVMEQTIAQYPKRGHVFLSKGMLYYYSPKRYSPNGDGEPIPVRIHDFWIEEERSGPEYRVTTGNEIRIGMSEIRYYLKYQLNPRDSKPFRIPIRGYRIDEGRHRLVGLPPMVHLWHLPLPFETGTHSMVCHRLDPEWFDRKTGKPYVSTVYEPTCQYCHNWLLLGDPRNRPVVRTVDKFYTITPGQKYCSPECRYAAQLKRQKYRYNYSRGNFKEIAPDGWINVREHLDMFGSSIPRISAADLPAVLSLYKSQIENSSRTSSPIDDLPRCDNCGGILQRKRMKRSAGKGQYCSDRCRKAYKRRLEKKLAWAA